jgi:hypothetical protein
MTGKFDVRLQRMDGGRWYRYERQDLHYEVGRPDIVHAPAGSEWRATVWTLDGTYLRELYARTLADMRIAIGRDCGLIEKCSGYKDQACTIPCERPVIGHCRYDGDPRCAWHLFVPSSGEPFCAGPRHE